MKTLVIVPTLNSAEFLDDCLESVKESTNILIADCRSSDQTLAIAQRHGCHILKDLPPWTEQLEIKARTDIKNFAIKYFPNHCYIWIDSDEILSDGWKEHVLANVSNNNCLSFPYWQLMGSSEFMYPNNPFDNKRTVFKAPFPHFSKMYANQDYHYWMNFEGPSALVENVARIHLGYTTNNLIERYIKNVNRLDFSQNAQVNENYRQKIKNNPFEFLTNVCPTSNNLIQKSKILARIIERHKQEKIVTLTTNNNITRITNILPARDLHSIQTI